MGGFDSTSVMALYKDVYLYHQIGKEKVTLRDGSPISSK